MDFLSSRKQLEYQNPIPVYKDLIVRRNLTVDKERGLFVLKGEVLESLSQQAGKPLDRRTVCNAENLLIHACEGTEKA